MFPYTCTGVFIEYQIIKEYLDPNWVLAEASLNKRLGCFTPNTNKLYSSPYNYIIANYAKTYESNSECSQNQNIINIEKKLIASQSIPLVSGNDAVSYYFGCDTVIDTNKKAKLQNKINLNENVKRYLKVNTFHEIITYLSSSSSSSSSSDFSSSSSSSSSSLDLSSSSSSSSDYNPFYNYQTITLSGWKAKQSNTGDFLWQYPAAENAYGDVHLNNDGTIMFVGDYQSSGIYIYTRNNILSPWTFHQKINEFKYKVNVYSETITYNQILSINDNGLILAVPENINNNQIVNIYTGSKNSLWLLHQSITGQCTLDSSSTPPKVHINKNGNILAFLQLCYEQTWDGAYGTGILNIFSGSKNTKWVEKYKYYFTGNSNYYSTSNSNLLTPSLYLNEDASLIAISSGSFCSVLTGNLNNGWAQKELLNANIINEYPSTAGFSIKVADSGNIILLGNVYNVNNAGAIYIYTGSIYNGWSLRQILSGRNTTYQPTMGPLVGWPDYYGKDIDTNYNASIIVVSPSRGYNSYWGQYWGALTPIVYTGSPINGWQISQSLSTGWEKIENTGIWSGYFGNSFASNGGFNISTTYSGDIIAIGGGFERYRVTHNAPNTYPPQIITSLLNTKSVLTFDVYNSSSSSSSLPNIITGKVNISTLNKAFIPVIGGEDYRNTDSIGARFQNYFPLMGNSISGNTSSQNKYYDFKIGNAHFFVLDNEPVCGGVSGYFNGLISEGAGVGENNTNAITNQTYEDTQRNWFNNAISGSTSKYKFVFAHRPSFASTSYHYSENGLGIPYFGNAPIYYKGHTKFTPYNRNSWYLHLADAVFAGNSRYYERIEFDQFIAPYIQILRNNNTLEIRYGISGYSSGKGVLTHPNGTHYMTHIPDYMTYDSPASTKINSMSIAIRTNNQSSFSNFNMVSSGSGFVYFYTLPSNTSSINFKFTNASGMQDTNTYDFNEYGYIYYTNNISNNFSKTKYFIVGNGGYKLESSVVGYAYIGSCVPGSCLPFPYSKKAHQECGFTITDIYNDGLVYTHYAYDDRLSTDFLIQDQVSIGNTGTQKLFSFACLANWGNNFENNPYLQTVNFYQDDRSRGNNYFQSQIAKTIKNKNVPYVFGLGNYIFKLQQGTVFNTGYAYLTSSSPYLFLHSNTVPNLLDQNIGAFWFDYIPFYRGSYTGYTEVQYPFIYSYSFSGFTLFNPTNIESGLRNTCEFIKIQEPQIPEPKTHSIWISVNQ